MFCAYLLAKSKNDVIVLSAGALAHRGTLSDTGTVCEIPCMSVFDGDTASAAVKVETLTRGVKMIEDFLTQHGQAPVRRDFAAICEAGGDPSELETAYRVLMHCGKDAYLLDKNQAAGMFAYPAEAALLVKGGAITVDPVEFTHLLADEAESLGARIYENTSAEIIGEGREGEITAVTEHYANINAKKAILACGCGIKKHMSDIRTLRGYVIVTEPAGNMASGSADCVLRILSEKPVTVARDIVSGRVLASGLSGLAFDFKVRDAASKIPGKRHFALNQIVNRTFITGKKLRTDFAYASDYPVCGKCDAPLREISSGIFAALISGENGLALCGTTAEQAVELLL